MTTISADVLRPTPAPQGVVAPRPATPAEKPADVAGGETRFTFSDFLSVINPLQHIPVVGSIYRAITGDKIAPAFRVLSGALLGGPLGLVASVAGAIVEQTTGMDPGEQAVSLFMPAKTKPAAPALPPEQFASTTATPAELATANVVSNNDTAAEAAPVENPVMPQTAGVTPELHAAAAKTPARSLLMPASAPSSGTSGKTLADYQAYAGHRMPVVDLGRGGTSSTRNTPIPLQTTLPLAADQVRSTVIPAAKFSSPAPTAKAASSEPAAGESVSPPAAAPAEGKDWVAAAMLRGLDRYREMKRSQMKDLAPPAQRLDTVL